MDFAVSEAMQDLLERIKTVLQSEVFPLESAFLNQRFYAIEPRLQEVRRKVQAAGLWAPQAPAELGGLGLRLSEFALVSEVLGQSPLGHYLFGCQAPDAGNIEVLHKYGTPEQHERFLRPLVRGELRSCFAMTEPDTPGSNPTQLHTRAVRDGDHYAGPQHPDHGRGQRGLCQPRRGSL
jgi:alkylation response protein AidB-like acyl-CoA dehydrogenase